MENTEKSVPDNSYVYACSSSELEEDDLIEYEEEDFTIVVGRVEGKVYAVDGICSHEHSELIDGELDDNCLTCPLHFACFDIRDGSVLEGPATEPLQNYETVEIDGSVWIKL